LLLASTQSHQLKVREAQLYNFSDDESLALGSDDDGDGDGDGGGGDDGDDDIGGGGKSKSGIKTTTEAEAEYKGEGKGGGKGKGNKQDEEDDEYGSDWDSDEYNALSDSGERRGRPNTPASAEEEEEAKSRARKPKLEPSRSLYFCEVCKMDLQGQVSYAQHIEGKKHRKQASRAAGAGVVAETKLSPSLVGDKQQGAHDSKEPTGTDTSETTVAVQQHLAKLSTLLKSKTDPITGAPLKPARIKKIRLLYDTIKRRAEEEAQQDHEEEEEEEEEQEEEEEEEEDGDEKENTNKQASASGQTDDSSGCSQLSIEKTLSAGTTGWDEDGPDDWGEGGW
jgi:hypothetical protein